MCVCVQLKLECSISSSQRMLAVREAIMELVDSNTSVAMLAKQRLEDVKSELARYREEIEIFSVPSDHCCLFYSCARETFRLFAEIQSLSSSNGGYPEEGTQEDKLCYSSSRASWLSGHCFRASQSDGISSHSIEFESSTLSGLHLHYVSQNMEEMWPGG